MTRTTRYASTVLALAAVLAAPARAQLPTYAPPQLQARTNLLVNDNGYNLPPGSSFNSISADIDDGGRVAFPVQVVPNGASSSPGVWFGPGDGSGGIVFYGPLDSLISSSLRMNDDGLVVFTLFDTGGQDGIWRYDHAVQQAARVGTSPVFPNSYSTPGINAAAQIGFQATFAGGRAYASVAPGAGALIHVADRGIDPGSSYTYLYTPAFDDTRGIVGKVATSADLTSATEIRRFASDGSSVRLAANRGTDPLSPIRQFDNSLALSDLGRVAFVATREADSRRAVYRIDGAGLTEIAVVDPAGTIRELESFPPTINDAGLVAFRARDANGQAIYVGDGVTLARVAGKGDQVTTDLGLGQIGQHNTDSVFSGTPMLNNRGDLVFIAALHPDGQNQIEWGTGVFVAKVADTIFADGFEP
ncbi:choice-of-anchor tandem repeat NxxGxxAF-containing protein [Tahibacter caeni]|uniref:choice-of-anchor tandem repeat NxxGxxAF-containing protein n=1 Tax=Tahibacter caeni TaxID=1453545 RepID=UPI002148B512|nr:choice-of-anchor tandem repeat NxxGxxAF-containing protein [Tahibacter caeni]